MKRETIRAMLGLTQQEMAMLLNVSRGQWSMYESNRRNLPLAASLRLGEMIVYMLSPESKALKNLPDTDKVDNEIKKGLEKRLKENDYQQQVITRKIERAQQKLEQYIKAAELMHFINSPAQIKKAIVPQIIPSTTAVAIINYRKYTQEVRLLQLDLELLQGQQQVLQKAMRKVKKV
jgi:transcriptional regulator with XRE-family HTH domain